MADKKLEIVIEAQDKASKTMSSLGGIANKTFSTIGTMAKTAGIALGVAGGATIAFGVQSMKAFADAESASIKLSQNLLTVKGNTEEHIKVLQDQASALQKVGVIEGDAIIAGQSQLATFGLQAKTIETLTPKIADMATQLDGYNVSQETMVTLNNLAGKVMTGQVGALSRYGVTLTDAQAKVIKMGKEQEKADMIAKVLSQNYGKINEALGKTPYGKVIQLKNAWGDAQEAVGGMLTDYLTPMFEKISQIANKLSEMNVPATLTAGFNQIRTAVMGFFSDTNVVWQFLQVVFVPMFMFLKNTAMDAFNTIKNALTPILPELKVMAMFIGVVLMGAIVAIGWIFGAVFKTIANIVTGFVQIFAGVITILKGIMTALTMGITGDWSEMVNGLKLMWQGLRTTLAGIFRVIFAPFASAWDAVYNKIQEGIKWLTDGFSKVVKLWNEWRDKKEKAEDGKPRATGGSVMAGKKYWVGENGPEMFIPSVGGKIDNSGSGNTSNATTNISFNFSGAVIGDKQSLIAEIERVINRRQELTSLGIR